MERMIKTLASLLLISFAFTTFSKDIPPRPNRLVNDYAKVLSATQVDRLEKKLANYDLETSTQMAVVIFNSLEGDDLFDYSQRLSEEWGIGGEENDNGVLLLVSIDDRNIRIHTGYGTEGAIPDAIAKRIIENDLKPNFRKENYYAGIEYATNSMMQALAGEYKGQPAGKGSKGSPFGFVIPLLVIFFIVMLRRRRYTGYSGRGRRHYDDIFWMGGMGSGSSGGSGFGGGGGFGGMGGGGFGGGGASGSW